MNAGAIAKTLNGRRCGKGWIAKCVAHNDRSPSLSLRDAEDGRILVHCFGGCEQARVVQALRERGLWPQPERRPERVTTAAERKALARARRDAPALARRAAWWRSARLSELEDLKREAFHPGGVNVDALAAAARAHHILKTASAAGVIALYHYHAATEPDECARLVAAGRAWDLACRRAVDAVVRKIQREQEEAQRVAA
jgi:hypothetical protein